MTNSSVLFSRHQAAVLRHTLLVRRYIRRNRLFFEWVFHVVKPTRNVRGWALTAALHPWVSPALPALRRRRGPVRTVGPDRNLLLHALITRMSLHGHRARARCIIERALALINDTPGVRVAPSTLVAAAVARLIPPFELKSRKKFSGVVVTYPAPMWPHRKHFFAAKLLAAGAKAYAKHHRCNFYVALATEAVAVYNQDFSAFSLKMYTKLLRLGLTNATRWRSFVRRL